MSCDLTIPPRRALKRARKQCRRMCESVALPVAIRWDEQLALTGKHFIDAKTFPFEPIFDIPSAKLEQIGDADKYVVSPERTCAYQNRVLHYGTPLELHGHGYVMFSDDVVIPMLIDMNRDHNGDSFPEKTEERERVYFGNVWMSLTPNEMWSQRDGIEIARDTVVIGGLGLGWFLRQVCEKESVEKVIVVDASNDLLDWYGYDLCAQLPKVTDVICDDIYRQVGRHGDDAIYLLDIWPTQDAVNDDEDFIAAKQRLGNRLWGWGWRGFQNRSDYATGIAPISAPLGAFPESSFCKP